MINIEKKYAVLFPALLILIYLMLVVKTAWLSDDAYITFRTIDNFVNGYGLRWNIIERVQSYTHPLWLFLLSAIYYFTREIFFTSLIISILISVFAVGLLVLRLTISFENLLIVLFSAVLSKSFIDYSTSGLENPLTNLLLIIYAVIYFNNQQNKIKLFLLSLLSALIMTNRLDTILLVLPSFLYYVVKNKSYKNFPIILLGFLPFIIWELFSILYYGFPFPNTAYAKLNTGIDKSDLVIQGFKYFYSSFKPDPLTLVLIFTTLILSFVKQNRKLIPLSLGIMLYLIYILWIGGDFMSGRFFVAPLVVAIIIISRIEFKSFKMFLLLLFIVFTFGIFSIYNTMSTKKPIIDKYGICDERFVYYEYSNLIDGLLGKKMPSIYWALRGEELKKYDVKFVRFNNLGFFGYFVGRQCYILDDYALSNPLLARLPSQKNWRIGHYQRSIPEGYEETLRTGTNEIKNPSLSEFYNKIKLIISGDLFDVNRINTIVKMNTGQFNYLLDDYINSNTGQ